MPTSATPLAGKVALITGSSRGMGRQNAIELASRGADIVIHYATSSAPAEEAVQLVKSMGRNAISLQADVSDPPQIATLFEKAFEYFGRLDIVVSNSGVEQFGRIDEVTPQEFDRVFGLNTRGQFFVAQQAFKHLNEGGRLILMSSISAQARGVPNHSVYAGSKAAVEAFTRCFATDFGVKQITVNAIAPGGVKTDMYREAARKYLRGAEGGPNGEGRWSDEKVDEVASHLSPLDRIGVPEDIARVIAFLASEDGRWINGQVIAVSGGAGM